jgi:transposase-like protein
MQQLITWFLNDVMNEVVAQPAEYRNTRDRVREDLKGMGYRSRSLKECLSYSGRLPEYSDPLNSHVLTRTSDTIHRFPQGVTNCPAFPPEFLKKIRTTNILERVNKELNRWSKKIGAFPNNASLLRLAVQSLSILTRSGSRVTGIYLSKVK